jgi:hypothetical protein
MKVAISQSNYLPWRGFFALIASVDLFVFLDEVQFTSRDWRSRNLIKTKHGLKWISIPVGDSITRRVKDVILPKGPWRGRHLSQILQAYEGSTNFEFGANFITRILDTNSFITLSEFNKFCIERISREIFQLKTHFVDSSQICHSGQSSSRIYSIAKEVGAQEYLSGPNGRNYLDVLSFNDSGIKVSFADYSKLEIYPQLHGPFVGNVSIVDLIFNVETKYESFIKL